MTTKTKVLLSALTIIVSFALGRWATPTKIITKTEIVEVEKKTDNKNTEAERDKHKTTTTTETSRPDGTKTTTTTTTEDSTTHKTASESSTSDSTKTTETSKEVTRSSDKVTISVLGSLKLNDLTSGSSYGGMIYKPILGPIGLGIGFLTNTTIFVSLGLSL